jgi:Uma2 family endonuclease
MNDVTAIRPVPLRRPKWRPIAPSRPTVVDEHDLYPIHEEDNVAEKPLHREQVRYLEGALAACRPDKWVTGNLCMYWEERNFHLFAAPDVLVVDCEPPDPLPGVYLRWADAPPLLVIEVGSKSTFVRDEGPKLETYELDLEVPEYLYYHPTRHDLRFHRLGESGYEVVPPEGRGWVHSETLDVWFGVDETGWLRVYTPAGERLLGHEEAERARQEAEARAREAEAEMERLRAELARFRAAG